MPVHFPRYDRYKLSACPTERIAGQTHEICRSLRSSLSAKLLVMTVLFVMLAEVLIFAPSVARFRETWLEGRMAAGHLAALTIEAAPDQMVTRELERKLLPMSAPMRSIC